MISSSNMKNHQKLLLHMCIFHAAFIPGSQGTDETTITPQLVEAVENTNATITCSYYGGYANYLPQASFKWFLNTTEPRSYETGVANSDCLVPAGWLNSYLYSYTCVNISSHSVTMINIAQQRHGEMIACKAVFRGSVESTLSNIVTVRVTVSVKSATVTPDKQILTIPANETPYLMCITSPCRPKPKFRWYVANENKPDERATLLTESEQTGSQNDAIRDYSIQFNVPLNKTMNGRFLFCGASNSGRDFVLSKTILLNVTYPSNAPPQIEGFRNGSEIKVIKDGFINLRCAITGGNPLPRLEWNKYSDMPQIVSGSTVTRNIKWQAVDTRKDDLTCEAFQFALKYTTYVSVDVLYPPEVPKIKINTSSGAYVELNKVLNVIEGRPFTLKCYADSNPPVSSFQWNNLMPTTSDIYTVSNADRRNIDNIVCSVTNKMEPTGLSSPVNGYNSSFLQVNVLYPPAMNIVGEAIIIDGENLYNLCNFTPGNPPETNITWSWKGSTWNVNSRQSYNVSRNESGSHRCNVGNLMISSDGSRVSGNASGEFNLLVQYKTKVLKFVINEQTDRVNVTINENSTVNLTCEIEGLPLPTGQLLHQSFLNQQVMELPQYLISQISTNLRLTSSFTAQCTNTGIHTCAGTNILYNGWQSVSNKSIALFVMCKPRMSPFTNIIDKVSSTTLVDVTLSFTALAYPVPPESGYVWTRQGETPDVWVNISSSGNKTNICTRGLQSNLTIKDISKFDYGIYRLLIFNDVGQYNHTFTLVPAVYGNDGSSASSSSVSVVAASVAGTVVGVVIVVAVIIIIVYRKRKSLSYQKKESSMQYYNVRDSKVAELNISTQEDNANSYEAFQSKGSDQQYDMLSQDDCKEKNDGDGNMSAKNRSLNVYEGLRNTGFDQQYEQISPIASRDEKEGQPMVYENLQLTRNTQNSHDAN